MDLAAQGRKPRPTSFFLLHGAFPGLQEMLGIIPFASDNVHDLVLRTSSSFLRNRKGDFKGQLWRFYHTGDQSDLPSGWEPGGDWETLIVIRTVQRSPSILSIPSYAAAPAWLPRPLEGKS